MGGEGQLNMFTQLVVAIILAAPRCIHREFVEHWRLTAWQGAPVKEFTKWTLDKGGEGAGVPYCGGRGCHGEKFYCMISLGS